jgi:dihydrofolate synthase / folylpolyglutamate synthase
MSETAYREALAWLYSFSDTERTGQFVRDREDNLARERALLAALGDPHRAYGVTHVAGTKGKGSTSAMIAAIMQAAGVRTGLYTQPDLHTFRERMRVNGRLIAEDEAIEFIPLVRDAVARAGTNLGPYITYEVATALAFLYFREAQVEHAVIEVGLGGRLDATNVVAPLVTVITSISYDHMQVLGNTLAEIAGEKAGIVKTGVPLVTSAQAPEALAVFERVARERGAPLVRVGPGGAPGCDYTYRPGAYTSEWQRFDLTTPSGVLRDLELSLLGEHQLENAAAAVAAAEQLAARGLPMTEEAIRAGLQGVRWPARMQVVGRAPWIVVDGAHNADSFARLFAALRRHFSYSRGLLVLALMVDKDIAGIAAEVGRAGLDRVICTTWNSARAATPEAVATALAGSIPAEQVTTAADVGAALSETLALAHPDDLVVVAGSVAFAGAALRWLAANTEDGARAIDIAGVDH